jgi:hypothetical protein
MLKLFRFFFFFFFFFSLKLKINRKKKNVKKFDLITHQSLFRPAVYQIFGSKNNNKKLNVEINLEQLLLGLIGNVTRGI